MSIAIAINIFDATIDNLDSHIYITTMKFEELISHFGSQKAVADALGIKQPSIAYWKDSGIPEPRQFQIEVLTGGALKADRRQSKVKVA